MRIENISFAPKSNDLERFYFKQSYSKFYKTAHFTTIAMVNSLRKCIKAFKNKLILNPHFLIIKTSAMKKIIIIILLFLYYGFDSAAQFGYSHYQTVNNLKLSTKWGKARDEDGNRKSAILLAFDNKNDYAVKYSFEILLYYEGILRENGIMDNLCLDGLKSNMGKLNGIYFIPKNFTEEQLKSTDFKFEIDITEVEEIENCDNISDDEEPQDE